MSNLVGRQFGNYSLLRLLGQGGFADVYLGEHIHLNTLAAIKVLRTQLGQDDITNFRTEARTIAHLTHPNIVRVLEFDVEGNTPFLVMEYAPNGTLRQRHRGDTALPQELVLQYVKQVAAALQYAHNQKIIHRDIKPENMLLGRNNEVLLSDFGIALVTQNILAQSMRQANSEVATAGSVAYMAPEQNQGKPCPASDQYGLAVVVYEWLCGVRPFNGSYMAVAVQHMQAPPPPMREKMPTISPNVEKVVLTALAKDPKQRFGSVQAFANAFVQACQEEETYRIISSNQSSSVENGVRAGGRTMEAVLHGPMGRTSLGATVVTMGRAQDNQLVISDSKVSFHHAEIRPGGQGYSIIDLRSMNGTFVNEQQLIPGMPRQLNQGDAIRIGDTTLTYVISGMQPISEGPAQRADVGYENPGLSHTGYGLGRQYDYPDQALRTPLPYVPAPPLNAGPIASGGPALPVQQPYRQPPGAGAENRGGALPLHEQAHQGQQPYRQPVGPGAENRAGTLPLQEQPHQVQQPYKPPPGGGAENRAGTLPLQEQAHQQPRGMTIDPNTPPVQTPYEQLRGNIPPSSSPKKPRRRLWIVVSIIAVVLLIGAGVLTYVALLPTPAKALDSFCTSLQGKDYPSAYNQLSGRFQSKIPLTLFTGFFGKVNACSHSSPNQSGSNATGSLTLGQTSGGTKNDTVTLTQNGGSAWKIDDEARLSGLINTLSTYCTAIQNGNYGSASSQFSSNLQSKISQTEYNSFLSKAQTCTYSTPTTSGDSATSNVTLTYNSGQTETHQLSLIQDSSNTWKIDSISNLPDQTIDTFCTALQNKDYQTAYNQLSVAYQGNYPESQFAKDFSAVTGCAHDASIASNSTVTSNGTFYFNALQPLLDTIYLVKDSSGNWKIDAIVNLPDKTLTTFCTALQNKDYQTAYDQLSDNARSGYSETQFASDASAISTCSHDFPVQVGGTATAILTLGNSAGQTGRDKAFLIKDSNGDWKIDRLQKVA
jgi:serine/threonine protein kinase/limonene-1,2-epoxide hydrolase